MSPRSRVWLVGCAALALVAAGWVLIIAEVQGEHDRLVAAAAERVRTRAIVFGAFVDSAFGSAALALRQFDTWASAPGIVPASGRPQVQDILRRTVAMMPIFDGLAIADKAGDVVVTARDPAGPPANVADRGYFAWHRSHVSPGLLVSPPRVTRLDDAWAIPISLRIDDLSGAFGGVVIGSLRPDYFSGFMRSLNLDAAVIALGDGSILVREPSAAVAAARRVDHDGEMVRQWLDKTIGGTEADLPVADAAPGPDRAADVKFADGVAQVASYVPLKSIPGAVFARIDLARELAPWRREAQYRMIGGAVYTLLVVLLAWAILSGMAQEDKRAAALGAARDEALRAQQRAEEAERNKSVFLAHTSHELRTPLNAIIGFSEILAREVFGPLDKRYREYSHDIHHSGQHLLSVVNNILDLAKVSAGRWELARERFSLTELLDDIGRLASPEAELRAIELKRDVPADLPALYTDRRVMRQILLNLVANGIKFTAAGGVVAVAASRNPDGGITLIVLDTGIGIEPAEIEKIVKPFSNVSTFIARKQVGTGLGLPLCCAFVDLLGGELTITSQPGEGTTITVRLPAGCIANGPIDEIDATAAE